MHQAAQGITQQVNAVSRGRSLEGPMTAAAAAVSKCAAARLVSPKKHIILTRLLIYTCDDPTLLETLFAG
jgi:hypothetical protein